MKDIIGDISPYGCVVFLMKASCSLLLVAHVFDIVCVISPLLYFLMSLCIPWFIFYCFKFQSNLRS